MDQFGGSAVLGGIVTGLMLWAWALGRLQGGLAAASSGPAGAVSCGPETDGGIGAAPEPVQLCQQVARDERRHALEASSSLGQVHAEVSAYRRAVQVLSHLEAGEMAIQWPPAQGGAACRYVGISGKPTCPTAIAADTRRACSDCATGLPDLAIRLDQPSAEASGFTRV